jgi:heat shock protein HslJ
MNKFTFHVITFSLFFLIACAPRQKQVTTKVIRQDTTYIKDSIEFYETEFEARQKNYLDVLVGSWNIDTMHRQARLPGEQLRNVYITFNNNNTFSGNAGCNRISGRFILKGTSIKFENIISTEMACPKIEEEIAFLKLLQGTVSAYTVTQNTLWLRDGASNVVFHASRRR